MPLATIRPPGFLDYGQRLGLDREWALYEGSWHFQRESSVFKTLRKLVSRLEDLGLPYAVAGCLAMFEHGFRRFTEVVEILVARDDLKVIRAKLKECGYFTDFIGGKHLIDAEYGVRIRFLVTGEGPTGAPGEPVVLSHPVAARIRLGGMPVLCLSNLVEMKITSGMASPSRLRDLADVVELIKVLDLPQGFADSLDPYVRKRYTELWNGTQESPPGP
ncbi:hypothetical protein ACYOEI_27690 [Singulisphaera rosea]